MCGQVSEHEENIHSASNGIDGSTGRNYIFSFFFYEDFVNENNKRPGRLFEAI